MKEDEIVLHGECMVFKSKLPADATQKQPSGSYMVVAPSETTGNHHVVDCPPGVQFYEMADGTLFMENSVETQIRCVVTERHDSIKLAPGTYEFGSQQEFDPFTARMQKVRD